MKILLVILLIIFGSGCVSFAKSEKELTSSGVKSPEFCIKDDFNSAVTRLEKYISECYRSRGVNLNGVEYSSTFYVSKNEMSSGYNYLIKMPIKGGFSYLFSISIERVSGDCTGKIQAIRSIKGIGNPFQPFEAIANNQKPSCPI